MEKMLTAALAAAFLAGVPSALPAGQPQGFEVSLCQREIKAQVELAQPKARIGFKDKEIKTSAASEAALQVDGKGTYTKNDGTVKKFDYTCRVNTKEGRVVNATWRKTGTKD